MIKNKFINIILILLLISGSASAQQSPCSKENLRASYAEAQLEAERVKNELLRNQLNSYQNDLFNKNNQLSSIVQRLGDVSNKLSIEQNNFAILTATNQSNQQKIVNLERLLLGVKAERDLVLFKIKKANGTLLCEMLSIGCVSLKDE